VTGSWVPPLLVHPAPDFGVLVSALSVFMALRRDGDDRQYRQLRDVLRGGGDHHCPTAFLSATRHADLQSGVMDIEHALA
jgi:hypothetical protein